MGTGTGIFAYSSKIKLKSAKSDIDVLSVVTI